MCWPPWLARWQTAGGSVDVNTARSLRVDYAQTFWVEDSRFKLVQHGSVEADGRRARLDFEWLVPAARLWRHVRETLWHVSWTDAEIRQASERPVLISCGGSMASTFVRRCQAWAAERMPTISHERRRLGKRSPVEGATRLQAYGRRLSR